MKVPFKRILRCLILAAVIIGLVWCGISFIKYASYTSTNIYKLDEIEEGVYGYYNVTVSSIPAENYDMITLYFGGRIYTLDGDVKIHYTTEEPKVVWTYRRVVHGDRIEVYVPEGSIIVRPNVNVGG